MASIEITQELADAIVAQRREGVTDSEIAEVLSHPIKRKRKRQKGNLNSYQCFIALERPKVQEKYPDADFAEIGRILGGIWRDTADVDRDEYIIEHKKVFPDKW